ncbi:TonB dependent receptor [Kordia sp. SMS9]|uniref:TonB-dependent receptor n=1 Tax=Kordia sp. SMS9 TaxID=2282170 RepID=UPI000E0D53A8|nr:TonB-dependent receptor [Kordia sp. SMS9]AXG72324.1 TonB dependent receptor [Kordia sp. SMS9]
MRNHIIKSTCILAVFLIANLATAQDKDKDKENIGTEVVNVVKPYTPSVSDAFKIKQTPSLNDKETAKKKEIKYAIFSFPVASTFTPAKGRAANLKKAKPEKLYNTYVSLGLGNYNTAALDFYTSRAISRDETFDISLRHHSSQGDIEGVVLDNNFFDTKLDLAYINRSRDLSWKAKAGYQHQIYNWYGLPDVGLTPAEIGGINEQQTYHNVYLGADVNMEDSFFNGGNIMCRRMFDATSSGENRLILQPEFEVEIAGELINAMVDIDYVGGTFKNNYAGTGSIDYSILKAGISPSLVILRDDLTVNFGAGIYVGMDLENSENDIFIYPRITAQYRLSGDDIIAYAGIEGDLQQNSYYDFVQENFFMSPTLGIAPTDQQYNGYLGIKGKLTSNVSYNARASYISEKGKPLFRANTLNPQPDNGYSYGNSFTVLYDDVTTLSVFGEINVDITSNFKFGAKAEYFNYSTDQQEEAWNLPELEASIFADYQITENWFAGANIFFIGERKDQFDITGFAIQTAPVTVTLDSFIDVNAHLGYRFNDRLSVFAKANNIANQDYQRWVNFPVQQFQIMAGATYKFDF